MNRWRQVVEVLNQPFTGPALAMTTGAATGVPTLQRRGDRALCLSALSTSRLLLCAEPQFSYGPAAGTVAGGPVHTPLGALMWCTDRPEWQVPAASVGSSATPQLRGSRPRHAGRDRGVRFEAAGAAGMVSGGRGTSALSHPLVGGAPGHRRRAVAASDRGAGVRTRVLRAATSVRFCWHDPVCYASDPRLRIWLVGRDGSGNRSLHRQEPGQWVSHRLPGPGELAFVDQPNGVRASDVMTGRVLTLANFGAWQAEPSPDGGSMVADSNPSDIGLRLFTVSPGGPLCGQRLPPLSATEGALPLLQWAGLCLRAPAHPSAPLLSRLLPRTEPVTVCYRGWMNRYQGLLPSAKFGYGYSEVEKLCPTSAVQLGVLLISEPYPCRLVLCGLSDTLGLLDCVMLP